MQSHHGSGAVIDSSRKAGFEKLMSHWNLVERVLTDLLPRSPRIERGYLKRTAGGTVCVNNHGDSRGTRSDGNGHPAAERTSTTAKDGDDDTRTRKRKTRTQVQSMVSMPRTARAGRSNRHTGDRKAKPVRRRSDEVCGLVVQTEIVPRSRRSAVSRGVDEDRVIVDTKTQRKPRERGKRTQHADVLQQLEGFEAWRQFVMEWEPKLRTRYVGLLMNVLGYRFRDDIPTKLAAFERTVHDYENQSTKTVDDDIKIGVTMLGIKDMRVKEHLIQDSVRITSWNQMREEILEHENTTAHRQSTNANAARSESEEQRQGQREQKQRQRQGHQGQRQGQGCEKRIVQESEKRGSEKVLLLQQNRPREGRVQQAIERPCRGRSASERKSVAASLHPHDATAIVPLQCLLPGERLVNICHSDALCEKQNVLRVFQ